ncbi:hypothetical protein [Bradyrhizobium sp. McL0616]|uniref:hypothetical protein n=1 Tax=Bradyrhizobium sp. McL0616 TaxID=3415674 RepID=UPI003CF08892
MNMSFKQAEMRRAIARKSVLRNWEAALAQDTKKLEAACRRYLKADGYTLKKIPAAHRNRELFGIGYMVINGRNMVELGATIHEYDASLEEVAMFAGLDGEWVNINELQTRIAAANANCGSQAA